MRDTLAQRDIWGVTEAGVTAANQECSLWGGMEGRSTSGVKLSTLFLCSQGKSHVRDSLLYCLPRQKISQGIKVCFWCWNLSHNTLTLVYLKETKAFMSLSTAFMHHASFSISHPLSPCWLSPDSPSPQSLPLLWDFTSLIHCSVPCSWDLFSLEAAVLFPAVLAVHWPCEGVSFKQWGCFLIHNVQ